MPSEAQLKATELRRRELLRKSREGNVWSMLGTWHGTILPDILKSPALFFNILLYFGFRALMRFVWTDKNDWPSIQPSQIGIIGGFMSFFLVFFASQTYSRFNAQYNSCMACEGAILDACTVARASKMPYDYCLRMQRHLNAVHILGYIGLSDVYNYDNFFHWFNEEHKLLNEEEVSRVKDIGVDGGTSAHREIVVWLLMFVNEQLELQHLSVMGARNIQTQILTLRDQLAVLYEHADQPIPFIYVHMVYLLTSAYLPIFSYGMAYIEMNPAARRPEIIGSMLVTLNLIFVVGIRVLGKKLSDPFGADVEDLSTMHYVEHTNAESLRIIHAQPPPWEAEKEVELQKSRPKLARGFSAKTATAPAARPSGPSLPPPVTLGAVEQKEGKRRADTAGHVRERAAVRNGSDTLLELMDGTQNR